MDDRATGVILRTHPLTESSLIVHWLTPDLGRLSTVAKGARRPQSPFRGKLDLFFEAEFSFARSRRSELHTLKEVVLRDQHVGLRRELAWLQQAAYSAALVEQSTEAETPLAGPHELLTQMLQALPKGTPHPLMVLAFEAKLLAELGLGPAPEFTRLSAQGRELLTCASSMDWGTLLTVRPEPAVTGELGRFLQGFLVYHLGRVPRNRARALHC